jgi:hypothetical protein
VASEVCFRASRHHHGIKKVAVAGRRGGADLFSASGSVIY